ncbi:MAG: DUF5686 and carboxypeptidase regulatory-like domain-containing protein [Bacteroidales bacterium]|nr:DUF5686 and carboxypeptidase regulatory-like domain-containing protein [Bacteroidales bacterium]
MRYYLIIGYIILFTFSIKSQIFEVSGRVYDANSRIPLPFVNIVINNGRVGGTTDIDGKFSFKYSEEIRFLSLSYVGYESLQYDIKGKIRNLIIRMKKTEYKLPEYVVFPTENPAHRIIKNAVTNLEYNDPEMLPAFSYTNYDKMIFTFELDSLPMIDTLEVDTSAIEFRKFLEKHHLFIMESVTERKFMYPDNNYENIIATKIAGFKDPIFIFLLSMMQSTAFYKDRIRIGDKEYINPISKGSIKKYFFLLQDTLYSGTHDSVFVISYRPRKNTNFDGLKGVISINTKHWAIQNVIAAPAETVGAISLRIEQMYEYVQNKQWFPVQLNTIAIMNNVILSDTTSTITLAGNVKDTTGLEIISLPFGFGKSYVKDIDLDPDFRRRDFNSVEVEVDPNAADREPDFWLGYRIDSLTEKELNTYIFVDSVSKAENYNRQIKTFESIITGRIPWGIFDLDINRFIGFNSYEGFALGLGIHTNDKLSQVFNIGGFFRYGFKDKRIKYGGDLRFMLYQKHDVELRLNYMDYVTETNGVAFFDDKQRLIKPEYFRDFLITRMDNTISYKGSIRFRTLKYLVVDAGFGKSIKQVNNSYWFGDGEKPLAKQSFDFTEVSIGLKYAHGEKFLKNVRRKISLGTNYPVVWFQYTRGIKDLIGGDYNYNRFDVKIEKSFYTNYLGETSFKIAAGYIDTDIPYTTLFNGNGAYQVFTIFAPNSFATMRMNEFLSSKYVALYFMHDFGKLLFQLERFKPEFAVATNIAFGTLDDKKKHQGIDYKTLEHGYYESGLQINNLLNLRIYSLGVGAYYRYGPYTFANGWDNIAWKVVLKFRFDNF